MATSLAVGQGVFMSSSPLAATSVSSVASTWTTEASVVTSSALSSATESPVLAAVSQITMSSPPESASSTAIDPYSRPSFTLTVTETSLTFTVPASLFSGPPTVSLASNKGNNKQWRSPKTMDDLSAFNIAKFSGGKDNLEVIQGVPSNVASASQVSVASTNDDNNSTSEISVASTPDDSSTDTLVSRGKSKATSRTRWDDGESSIQLLYPAGSINPAQRPVGGAQFYAVPIDLTGARNVTLEYSAYFPPGFDWVLGGKMPGLYGGHPGCSGGNAAVDCWSTRLMWREDGVGELYLYAPKDKQTDELCNDPQSSCNAAYGLSIGRGGFNWVAGEWTTVRQTVTLNTPGEQDGSFRLEVNGEPVIDRSDIYYRGAPPKKSHKTTSTKGGGGGGGLGGLLGTLLSDLLRRAPQTENPAPTAILTVGDGQEVAQPLYGAQQGWAIQSTGTPSETSATTTSDPQPTEQPVEMEDNGDGDDMATESQQNGPVGFQGIFFSSFFGGHEARYATPTDQYTWFKNFFMSYNA